MTLFHLLTWVFLLLTNALPPSTLLLPRDVVGGLAYPFHLSRNVYYSLLISEDILRNIAVDLINHLLHILHLFILPFSKANLEKLLLMKFIDG